MNTVYCIGRNYADHAKELNNPVPSKPLVFLKPNASIELDNHQVVIPQESQEVHYEAELVLLIGKKGHNIAKEKAWEVIQGVGVGIDFTARDIQDKAKEKGHPWTLAKGWNTFAPVSSFVPVNQIIKTESFTVELWLNEEQRQHGISSDMLFSIPDIITYISGFSTLHEGDLIFTGTPPGVGKVSSGDILKASLNNGLVTLEVQIV